MNYKLLCWVLLFFVPFLMLAQSLPAPILDGPPNNGATVTPPFSLHWNSVTGAMTYRIQLSLDDGFMRDIVVDQLVTSTAYTITSLPAGNYWWRVKAYGEHDSSTWSEYWFIKVNPATPTLVVTINQTELPYQGGIVQVKVTNTTGGTMNWTVQTDVPWLSASKISGVNSDSFYVVYDINRSGERSATMTVTAPGATNSPVTITFTQRTKGTGGVWIQTNGPLGGDVVSFACLRSNPLMLFINTGRNGIYRSLDTGKTWIKLGVCDTTLNHLEADAKRGRLYLANEVNFIYSTDGGNSWIQLSGSPYGTQAVAIDSNGNVYLGGGGGFPMQFKKSTDGGVTWTSLTSGLQNANSQCQALLAHPSGAIIAANALGAFVLPPNSTTWQSTNINFFVTSLGLAADNRTVYAGTHYGFYVSTDTGKTWTPRNTGLPGVYINGFVVLSNGDVLTSQQTNEEQQGGIFRLAANSTTWERINPNIEGKILNSVPIGGNRVFLSGPGSRIFVSTDGGYTFSPTDAGFISVTPRVLTSLRNGAILAATDAATIWKTTDKGSTWSMTYNGRPSYVYSIGGIGASSSTIFVATNRGILRSTDYGDNWQLFVGQPAYQCTNVLVLPPDGPNPLQVYVTTNTNVYRSLDSGITWTSMSDGLPTSYNITSIAQHFNGELLVGTMGDGVYRYDQANSTWIKCSTGLNEQNVTALLVNKPIYTFTGAVYAATKKKIFAAFGSSISQWEQVFDSPWDLGNACFGVKGYSEVYCGTTYQGIYRSTNYGYANSWSPYNDGFKPNNASVYSLLVAGDGKIYAGLKAEGVYTIGTVTEVEDQISNTPSSFTLYQNYPNPFNPSTTITFALPIRSHVKVAVYDLLGREVATLQDGVLDAGLHKKVFSAHNLPSGVYFCKLHTENYSQTQKLLLLK